MFVFKQKTAYDMRISDWSSDVCSSDLVERGELLRQEHALVDDRAAGQGADVELLDAVLGCALLDAAADDIEIGLELLLADAEIVADHDLLDLGPCRVGLPADDVDVHRPRSEERRVGKECGRRCR